MKNTTPLRIHVLFQPRIDVSGPETVAEQLAARIYEVFSVHPSGRGARIPVRFGPISPTGGPAGPVSLKDADRNIVVVLLDRKMSLQAGPNAARERWEEVVLQLKEECDLFPQKNVFLPVAVDARAFDLSDTKEFPKTSCVRLEYLSGIDRERHMTLHIATRALRLLQNSNGAVSGVADTIPSAPINIFVSHAKKDLPQGYADGPVKAILAKLVQGPVEAWYDAAKIDAGANFEKALKDGVQGTTVLIVVLSDTWSLREWCRREILMAKKYRAPIIVVGALQDGCDRLFPYVGNCVTVQWRAATLPEPKLGDGTTPDWWGGYRSQLQSEDADRAIVAALTEALRCQCDLLYIETLKSEGDVVLGSPPEALTINDLEFQDTNRIWYPDPPLGQEELEALSPKFPPEVFTTPLSELTRWPKPDGLLKPVALSLSGSPDALQYGGSPQHLTTLAEELVLYLLLAGLKVCYGGTIGHGGISSDRQAKGDEINYIEKLFGMVRSYSPLAKEYGTEKLHPIENYVAWPIWRKFTDEDYEIYGAEAELVQIDQPDGVSDEGEGKFFKADMNLEARYAWCRGLTEMRQAQIQNTSARIALGGKLAGSVSRWPGVLEEIVLTLRAGQPLYLMGTFGGAARLVVDFLTNPDCDRIELTTEWFREHHLPAKDGISWDALAKRYQDDGLEIETPESLVAELAGYRERGIANVLSNGLDEKDNLELFNCDDPRRAIALILQGLSIRFG